VDLYKPILKIKSLKVDYKINSDWFTGIDRISLCQKRGKNIGIIGESGSGKTTLAHSIMGLIDSPHKISGEILYEGVNLMSISNKDKKKILWNDIALVFQNSLEVLNPIMSVGKQLTERLVEINGITKKEAEKEQIRLLRMVDLEEKWKDAFPHQLSGGMRQRVLIAMAISCKPKLVIFDEPTSSMDAILKKKIIKLIKRLQQNLKFSMIVISHDLSIMKEIVDSINVMYAGSVIESGSVNDIINNPKHPYTRGLINSSVEILPYKDLWGIPGEVTSTYCQGCSFAPRCTQSQEKCFKEKPELKKIGINREIACHRGGIIKLLDVKNIQKNFKIRNKFINAVNDVSFCINHGETVALVGQSGSGKSTIAKIVSGYLPGDKGKVYFEQKKVIYDKVAKLEEGIQIVLQDPFSALSHRLRVEEIIKEPLEINKIGSKEERNKRVKKALRDVQLPQSNEFLNRFCNTLSGGQRQRVAVARALVMKPKILIADEVTSMLDLSTQANMIRLLKGLQNRQGFAMLYITHDIYLSRKICERIIVLENGEIVDMGSSNQIIEEAYSQSTKRLVEAGLNK